MPLISDSNKLRCQFFLCAIYSSVACLIIIARNIQIIHSEFNMLKNRKINIKDLDASRMLSTKNSFWYFDQELDHQESFSMICLGISLRYFSAKSSFWGFRRFPLEMPAGSSSEDSAKNYLWRFHQEFPSGVFVRISLFGYCRRCSLWRFSQGFSW